MKKGEGVVVFDNEDIKELVTLLVTIKNRILSARKMTGCSFEKYHKDTVGMINEYENELISLLPPQRLLKAVSSDPIHIADRLNLVVDFLNEKFKNDRQS